jgi:tetratricopeptide (TPR) repeat protein
MEKGARVEVVRQPLLLYRKRGASMYSTALDHDAELRAQIVLNHPGLYDQASEQWANALLRIQKAEASGAVDMHSHQTLASYYVARGRWHEALPHLTRATQAANVFAELRFLLGVARLKMKDFEGARAALRRCLDESPDHAPSHFFSAIAAACQGDLLTAAEYSDDAIELDLTMAAAYELRIAICQAQHDEVSSNDFSLRCKELQISVSPWVFSERVRGLRTAEQWAELLYATYLRFSPLPLLALNSKRSVNNTSAPKVSVILPTFNRPERLAEAIDSVLAQTFQDFEILVVNDAGTDVEAVVSARKSSGKITYVRHGKNKGLAAARNTGIRLARGEFITYLDDDDLFYPDHLQILVHCLQNNDCGVAYTDAHRAHQVQRGGQLVVTHRDLPFSMDFNHDNILVGNFIPVLCVMHRKSCLDEAGLFDETLTTHEDWDLWIRLSRKYRFGHIRKTTCEFSWRTDGTSMTSSKQKDFLRTLEIIYAKTADHVRGKPHVLEARQRYLQERKQVEQRQDALAVRAK